jgi:predicted dehydrogenase
MTLRVGIIGTGWFADKHAAMLNAMDGVRVTAIVGSSQEKADKMAGRYDGATGYGAFTEMLDREKLDAVYVCTPPFAHGQTELALAERGIPFFVEKPLAVDLDTPSDILEAVRTNNLITSVGYHFRYTDAVASAKEMLDGRTVGMAMGYWMGGMPGVYWWRKQEMSGGQFVEQTTHVVDLLRYLLGEVVEVQAMFAQRHKHLTEDGVTVPDVGTVNLRLKSGAIATIANTCMLPIEHTSGLHVYTDQGVLEIGGAGLKEIVSGRVTEYRNRSNPYELENQAFIHAVRTGDTSGIRSTYADAWKSQQITTAAVRSAQTGQLVRLG